MWRWMTAAFSGCSKGWFLTPSVYQTIDRAPSNTLGFLGQLSRTITGNTPGVCSSSLASTAWVARYSWAPGGWLGVPATRTTLASLGLVVSTSIGTFDWS